MSNREKTQIFPTLKVNMKKGDENTIKFDVSKHKQIEIQEITDVDTKHGKKIVLTCLLNEKQINVFINGTSKNLLIDAFGNDDDNWKGKLCNLTLERDSHFDTEMIVFNPVK